MPGADSTAAAIATRAHLTCIIRPLFGPGTVFGAEKKEERCNPFTLKNTVWQGYGCVASPRPSKARDDERDGSAKNPAGAHR